MMTSLPNSLIKLQEQTFLGNDALVSIKCALISAFKSGLSKDAPTMIPSFVSIFPDGTEIGEYLALDLGGTNLRVAVVRLLGNDRFDSETKESFVIPDEKKKGDALFDWIAEMVKAVLDKKGIDYKKPVIVGATFSFPVNQVAINRGTVATMGKGFDLDSVEGMDIVELMENGFKRKNLNMCISAIVNDAVSTLIAQMYKEPTTTIASIILGTGTNSACIVPIAEIKRPSFSFPQSSASDRMVINMEWSLMGADFLSFTEYDKQLDKDIKPGFQPFEKMVSGYYLHELVRLAIVDFVKKKELFGGVLPGGMERKYSFTSELMSDFERFSIDRPDELISKLSERYQLPDDIKLSDLEVIQSIVKCFSRRSAQLVAAGIAALVEFAHPETTETDVTIGIDGSVYSHYHGYSDMLTNEMENLVETRVRISEVKDGGCVGATIVAMLYAKKSK